MQVVPELVFREVLVSGFEWVRENIIQFDEWMAGLDADALADMKDYFSPESKKKIEIVQGWPREGVKTPVVAIITLNKTESGFIGEEGGISIEDGVQVLSRTVMWKPNLMILVNTKNADATLFLYSVIELIMLSQVVQLQEVFSEIEFSGGDLSPELQRLLPDYLYSRGLTVACKHPMSLHTLTSLTTVPVLVYGREASTAPFEDE